MRVRPAGGRAHEGSGRYGAFVASLPSHFVENPLRVPSACMSAMIELRTSSADAVSGLLLASANATDTVKIGLSSSILIGCPLLTESSRPFLLATMASKWRPAASAWMHSLSVGRDVTCGS